MENEGSLALRVAGRLGHGAPFNQIISSAIVAVTCLFFIYTVASQMHLRIFPLIHRITYYVDFQSYVINEYVDHLVIGGLLLGWLVFSLRRSTLNYVGIAILGIALGIAALLALDTMLDAIALASLPVIAVLSISSNYPHSRKIMKNVNFSLIIDYISILATIAGAVSLVYAFLGAASESPPQTIMRSYGYDIFLIASGFSPFLMLLLITCIPVKVLFDSIYKYLKSNKSGVRQIVLSINGEMGMTKTKKVILLVIIILTSIGIAIVPHLSSINKNNQQIGVDTGYYVTWVNGLKKTQNINDFLYQAFVVQNGGDRPLSLIFIYGLSQLIPSELFFTIEYLPLIFGPALALAIYFLTKELTSNDVPSLIAAFITAISYQTLIGIYAGFYANWIALILGYFSLVFFLRCLNGGSMKNLALYGVLTIMVLFAHVYTWSILSIVAGLFLIITIAKTYRMANMRKRNAILLLVVLLSTLVLDVGRSNIIGTSGGIEGDFEWANTLLVGPDQFLSRWNNLSYTMTTFVGGLFANFIVLGLGLYWLVRTRMQDSSTIFLIIFLSIGILPFLIGEWVIQTRVFYNVPFQIPAAIAVTYLIQGQSIKWLRSIPIVIWLVTAAIIALSNFYLVVPITTR